MTDTTTIHHINDEDRDDLVFGALKLNANRRWAEYQAEEAELLESERRFQKYIRQENFLNRSLIALMLVALVCLLYLCGGVAIWVAIPVALCGIAYTIYNGVTYFRRCMKE